MSQKPCVKLPKKTARVKQQILRPQGEPPRDTFQVVILCESEADQERLYNEFRSRAMQVRLLTM